ncbi:MAG: hypothetical protein LBL52_02830 [Rickettsiales bacterium]|jgi:hypothetical protein|nr:hypothetical protein [Rickettsiales bacterium]
MDSLSAALLELKKLGARFYTTAGRGGIDFASAMLGNEGLPRIPEDYIRLLLLTDGIAGGMVEIYGAKAKSRDADASVPADLFLGNRAFAEPANPLLSGRIVLGMTSLDLIVWDEAARAYQLLENGSFAVLRAFGNVEEMLGFIKEYL